MATRPLAGRGQFGPPEGIFLSDVFIILSLIALVAATGKHCESSGTTAVPFRNSLEDHLQDSLFGSTETRRDK